MLMLISTSAVAKQSSFVGDSLSVTGQTSRSSDVSAPVMPDSYDIEVDGLYYKITSISDREVELVGGEGVYSGSIEIPSELEYRGKILKVTSIGDMAFYNSDVTNVTIGGNVKKLVNTLSLNLPYQKSLSLLLSLLWNNIPLMAVASL